MEQVGSNFRKYVFEMKSQYIFFNYTVRKRKVTRILFSFFKKISALETGATASNCRKMENLKTAASRALVKMSSEITNIKSN